MLSSSVPLPYENLVMVDWIGKRDLQESKVEALLKTELSPVVPVAHHLFRRDLGA